MKNHVQLCLTSKLMYQMFLRTRIGFVKTGYGSVDRDWTAMCLLLQKQTIDSKNTNKLF